jgi:hypothetical protein
MRLRLNIRMIVPLNFQNDPQGIPINYSLPEELRLKTYSLLAFPFLFI